MVIVLSIHNRFTYTHARVHTTSIVCGCAVQTTEHETKLVIGLSGLVLYLA